MNFSEPQTVIVCLRNPAHGAGILKEAARTAKNCGAQLQILAVQPVEQSDEEKSRFVEDIYRLSRKFDAEMHVVFDEDPVITAARFIRSNNRSVVFTGMPSDDPNSFVVMVRQLLPDIMFSMVSEEGITYRLYPHVIPSIR
ncbi:MAG: hypothetical protein ACOYJR_03510 [Acutalibacteraceae bacterium]|jgi:K+-sensing histidine kinase KdpD